MSLEAGIPDFNNYNLNSGNSCNVMPGSPDHINSGDYQNKNGVAQLGEIIIYGLALGLLLTALAFIFDPDKNK